MRCKPCVQLFAISAVALLLSGCETFASRVQYQSVEIGMTRVQVQALAGAPEVRFTQDEVETWEYCANGWITDDFMRVDFDSSGVIATEILLDTDLGHCRENLTQLESDPA